MTTDAPEPGYDYLEIPFDAALALLRRSVPTGPVEWDTARRRARLRVPAGSAEALPELLEWLDWSGVDLDLTAGPGPRGGGGRGTGPDGVWLRPPEGGPAGVGADLVRLVSAAATECHRAALHRTGRRQPLAFSYASRISAGTRPRSLTL